MDVDGNRGRGIMRPIVIVVFASLLMGMLTACDPKTCTGMNADCTVAPVAPAPVQTEKQPGATGKPNPKPGDPKPPEPTPSNVRYAITMECTWKGARWMYITPWIGQNPVRGTPFERKYKEERDPGATGGTWSETYSVPPDTIVAIQCDPREAPAGLSQCRIKNFGTQMDYRQVTNGAVHCTGRTPK